MNLPVRALPHTLNCLDDVLIRAAATDVAAHEFLHLGVFRPNRLRQQGHRRHDLTACAVATLIGVGGNEGSLHCMQIFRLADALNGRDLFALMHCSEAETRIHAPAIDVYGARTALAVITSLFRAGQMQVLTEAIEQRRARIDAQIVLLAIDTQGDRNRALYRGHCFYCFRYRSRFGARAFPNTEPAEASKLAIPKRERNLRRVDFPNCKAARGVSFDWLCSPMEISLRVQSRIPTIIVL